MKRWNGFLPQKGSVALVLVLSAIAVITAIVLEIAFRSNVSAQIVVNRRDSMKAYELAQAAFQWSLLRLQLDKSLDQIPAIPGTNYGGKKDDLMEVQWSFPLSYPWPVSQSSKEEKGIETSPLSSVPSDIGGSFLSMITDESSKINLNDVGSANVGSYNQWSGAAEILENLLLFPRFKIYLKGKDHRELLRAMDDWVDADSSVNHLGGGIEDAEYRIPEFNFPVKNGPFYTLDEIRYLKPMHDDLFRELRPFVTIYPFEARFPRVSSQPVRPQGKININTAPLELIAAILNRQAIPNLRARLDCAQLFIKMRQTMVFRSISGQEEPSFKAFLNHSCESNKSSEKTPVLTSMVEKTLSVYSDVFSIEATGSVNSTEKTIHSIVSRMDVNRPKIFFWKVI